MGKEPPGHSKATIHVILSEAKNLKFLPESLRSPQSGPTLQHFCGGACPAEPERNGGEASEILRRSAPQNDIDIGPSDTIPAPLSFPRGRLGLS
jgi:hypothetical protein